MLSNLHIYRYSFAARSHRRLHRTGEWRKPLIERLEERRLLATTWYVATNGNDNNPGTLQQPFLSIEKAVSQPNLQPYDTIDIAPGDYYGWFDSTVPNLTIQNENPTAGAVTIMGVRPGATGFTEIAPNIWQSNDSPLPPGYGDEEQVFQNPDDLDPTYSVPMAPAMWPAINSEAPKPQVGLQYGVQATAVQPLGADTVLPISSISTASGTTISVSSTTGIATGDPVTLSNLGGVTLSPVQSTYYAYVSSSSNIILYTAAVDATAHGSAGEVTNTGTYSGGGTVSIGYDYEISANWSGIPAGDWTGAIIHITPSGASPYPTDWVSFAGTVRSTGSGYLTVDLPITTFSQAGNYEPIAGDTFYLQGSPIVNGIPTALVEPGQFYQDPNNNQLYLDLTTNPNDDQIMVSGWAPIVKQGNSFVLQDWIEGSNTTLTNINFFGSGLTITGNGSTVNKMNANYVGTFDNSIDDDGFDSTDLGRAGDAGIILDGTDDTIKNSSISNSAGDGVYINNTGDYVTGCQISNVDWSGCDYAGIRSDYGGNTIGGNMVGNSIWECGRAGINFRTDVAPGSDVIEDNNVSECMTLTNDGAGIYTFENSSGGRIDGNTVSSYNDFGIGLPLITGSLEGGIMLDNSFPINQEAVETANFSVYNNVTSGVGFGFKINGNATNCNIYDNILYATSYAVEALGTWTSSGPSMVKFYGNSIFDADAFAPTYFPTDFVQSPANSSPYQYVSAPQNPPTLNGTTNSTGTVVNLSWAPPSGATVTGYAVYREVISNFSDPQPTSSPPVVVASLSAGTTSWTDDAADDPNPPNQYADYRYYVVATNGSLNAYASNPYIDPPTTQLWADTTTPAVTNQYYGGTVELGLRFTTSAVGQVAGVQFYESPEDTPNTQVAHLWTSGGTLLATANFTNETSSGWQQVVFPQPVTIYPNTQYIVSYSDMSGHFASNLQYFNGNSYTNGPLTAPADITGAHNGVFGSTAGSFPNQTYEAQNYWVQPLFTAGLGTGGGFVGVDAYTQGTWTGIYGSQGYDVIDGQTSLPSYASVSVSGSQPAYDWWWVTGPQTLQVSPGSSTTVAACDYSTSSMTVNVNLTDGQTHQVSLYLLDGDDMGRTETIQAFNASTGAAITSAISISNFSQGQYAVFDLSGDVNIVITNTTPNNPNSNCVLSGIFFG